MEDIAILLLVVLVLQIKVVAVVVNALQQCYMKIHLGMI
ncbi:putative membrane protein [Bacteroides fragilis str. 2-F-2 |uniref:Putative membrane protein n=1 Tax=Bacteroides fragilis str. 2-F-2 \|nr:putative membrane protein [Bacteroides fragilis str. 2-F-2 \